MEPIILHCDANNYFASVECLARPELKLVPMAVASEADGKHGVILAKNDLAKPFGVKTGESVLAAMKKCPQLELIKPTRARYGEFSRRLNAIYLRYTDCVEAASIDESFMDVTDCAWLFGDGERIANELRRAAREELGLTISVGVSFNKTFAKLGSDYKKPDATTVISRENFRQMLYPLPAGAMLGVGGATAEALKRLGIHTIGDIAAAGEQMLGASLGAFGPSVWALSQGLDSSPVKRYGEGEPPKSIGNGITFPRPLVGADEIGLALLALTDSAARKLRAQRMLARTVEVKIKNPALRVISRQTTLAAPSASTREMYRAASEVVARAWNIADPVRMLTVTLTGFFSPDDNLQMTFFDDFSGETKEDRLYRAVDALKRRYGDDIIKPARLLTRLFGDFEAD